LWIIVLVANLVGAFIFAWVLGGTDVFDPNMRATFAEMGHRALSGNFGTMVLRGIFAGWLIALMVWLLPFAGEMRILVIILLTFLIGLGHFPHVIAGSVEVLYLVVISAASWKDFFLGFMLPALIGNVLGGVMLVAMLNHAQVVAGAGQDV
jgi:formate/nitrite transporter FocA (FNT family)